MLCEKINIQVPGSLKESYLQLYILDYSEDLLVSQQRPLILICPGGSYAMTSDREAEPVAMKYLAAGFHVAVLRYSVAPAVYPAAMLEVATSISYLRDKAEVFHIDSDKIAVHGFSAGGHLAACYGTYWNQPFVAAALGVDYNKLKPNGLLLSYPVITSGKFAHHKSIQNLLGEEYEAKKPEMSLELHAHSEIPPTFIWHTLTDEAVVVENALLYVTALHKAKVSVEFHLYPVGKHGLSLANELSQNKDGYGVQVECEGWIDLAIAWMHRL